MIGNYVSKKKKTKKTVEGVSTFCHLEGLDDQSTLDLLTNVFYGNITLDTMKGQAKTMKQKRRCFKKALQIAVNYLAVHNVLFNFCHHDCRFEMWIPKLSMTFSGSPKTSANATATISICPTQSHGSFHC